MLKRRVPLLTVASPAPRIIAGEIILHKQTWYGHIKRGHPEVELFQVEGTIRQPDIICDSRTRPGDWVFFAEGYTNEHHEGMRVSVRHEDGVNFVTTAYYSGSRNHGTVLWSV